MKRWIVESCRILLGIVFVFSGFVKAVDPTGGAIKIGEYLSSFGLPVLSGFDVILSINLSALEFALGVCMLMGVYRKFITLLTLIFMCFMTPLTLYLALFNPVSDCGCFGDALVISNWQTFFKNVVLLSAAIIVFMNHKSIYSIYTYKTYWFVVFYSYLFGAGFAYSNYNHLPILDFRPYKVGADLIALTSLPDSAKPDEYRYSLVYEKNGTSKEFSLDDYPSEDTTWHFVETRAELIKEGDKALLPDFRLFSADGEEITQDILHSERPVWLLVLSDAAKAYDGRIDDINDIYDYSLERDMDFYAISTHDTAAIASWCDNTGAEYPFLMADATMLKTMIRSNPGLLLLDKGVILKKWHYNDIPEEDTLDDELVKIRQDFGTGEKEDGKLLINILTFALPLCLVWIYDYFRFRRKQKQTEDKQTK
jgi:uncharacterized membrane protein YphA (DoxX/SURF4 family)